VFAFVFVYVFFCYYFFKVPFCFIFFFANMGLFFDTEKKVFLLDWSLEWTHLRAGKDLFSKGDTAKSVYMVKRS
jgi:hypothetical protein